MYALELFSGSCMSATTAFWPSNLHQDDLARVESCFV